MTLVNEVLLPSRPTPKRRRGVRRRTGRRSASPNPHLPPFGVEPSPPLLPLEHVDDLGARTSARSATRVSLHPSLLRYDVVAHDGAHVGPQPRQHGPALPGETATAATRSGGRGRRARRPRRSRDRQTGASTGGTPTSCCPGRRRRPVCLLHDMADIRNHRHHGLFGALVVPPDRHPRSGRAAATRGGGDRGALFAPAPVTPWPTRACCSCRTGCGCSSTAIRTSRYRTWSPATTRRTAGRRA